MKRAMVPKKKDIDNGRWEEINEICEALREWKEIPAWLNGAMEA